MEAGWPMMSVVPLQSTWVVANLKETQLNRVRVGQEARMEVDAFPDHPMIGRIESLAPASGSEFSLLPPQNASGNFIKIVQRIPVRIVYDLPKELAGRLVPGMSVEVTIDTRTAPDGAALAGINDD
jgi:membrane fusion protein (multidrug efflux system)